MKFFIILLLAVSAANAATIPVIIPLPYPALYVAKMVKNSISHQAKRCNKADKCHKGKHEENR